MKSITKLVAILLVLVAAPTVFAAAYPLPGKTEVACKDCLGLNFNGQKNAGLPTVAYSAPIVKHVGRLVDSSSTKDIQNIGIRTVRAGKIRLTPTRVYVKMGGAIGVYSLSSFFTTKLPAGMQDVSAVANVSVSRTKFNSPNELLTVWDAYVYAESAGSVWPVTPDDKQDVLHDFDIDDRGLVYAAYATFGWGIAQDGGEGGGQLLSVLTSNPESSGVITVVKAGSTYYMAVAANDSATSHKVYNVTNASSPSPVGSRNFGIRSWAKYDAGSRIAILDDRKQLRIYENATFGQGGAPLFGPVSAGAGRDYSDITFDENGNLWAVDESSAYAGKLHRLTPSGATYAESTFDVGEQFSAKAILPNTQMVSAANGFVAVAGAGLRGTDVMLFKVEGSAVRKLDLKNFFNKYYHAAPAGYANPPTDQSYVVSPYGLKLIKQNNKMYLMYNAHGMGDVYEIEAGDSIGATMRTASFGTVNPHSKATETGPFLGDVVKFVATSSNPAVPYQISWDFGNPESGANLAQTATGVDVSHQFSGYTTSGTITSVKKVVATAVSDPSLTDTVNVTLKVPVPRIGVAGTSTAITSVGPSFNVLLGDAFTDASDGAVEGHYSTWSIDGVPLAPKLPSQTTPVGAVGPHTVSLVASYGRYDASTFAPATSMYTPAIANQPYVVRPFLFTLNAVKSGTDAVFSSTARITTDTAAVPPGSQWNYAWTLKNNAGAVVQTLNGAAAVGANTVPNLVVPMANIPAGGTVTLDIVLAATQIPTEYATYSQSMTLNSPDPKITASGCTNASAPCTLTASSLSGASTADWVYTWTLNGVVAFTGNPYKPNFTVPGTYTVGLTAVKGIFDAGAQTVLTVAGAVCGPPPTADQVALSNNCGGGCDPGTIVQFKTSVFGYSRQDCDIYTWNWGDGSPAFTITGGDPNFSSTVTHKYVNSGTYTAKVTITNTSSGATPVVLSTTVNIGGGTPPPPDPVTCTRPSGIIIEYAGPSGCGANGTPCKAGSRITFAAYKNNGDQLSLSCDTASWNFGDGGTGSGRTAAHTFANAGNYTVTVNVSSSAGSASPVSIQVPIAASDGGSGSCSTAPTVDNLILSFKGATCSNLNGALCQRGESIQFDVKFFDYTSQSCDKFEWNFGDGATSAIKNPTHAYTGMAAAYTVTLRVYNTANPTGATITAEVPFDNAPIETTPTITVSGPTKVGKGATVTFTASSDLNATGWSWNFGDGSARDTSQAGLKSQSSSVSHVFTKTGTFTVSVTAKNANDTTDRSTGTGLLTNVAVSETPVYRFLVPAVIHAGGQNGSSWRTDMQVYYGAPNPSVDPLTMTADFNGVQTTLLINQATFIYEDFVAKLANGDASGSVILTTQAKYKPQIWTRTYNVDPSGKTFGQFIPAIELDGATAGTVDGSADPVKYYLSGLRGNNRYRTNVGFINTSAGDIIADVTAYDDLRTPLDRFAVTLPQYQLQQFSLGSKIANLPNRPITLEISIPAGKALVAYASFIDGASNDPVYISASSATELSSGDYSTSITPGVGHIGAWRSDVTILNPDERNSVTFDLEYYDEKGLPRGTAFNLTLGPLQSKNYEDLLRVKELFPNTPPDGLGMLKLHTVGQAARYPLTFSRTYNDKGSGGTFGQGIPGFAATRANVKTGKAAIIPGVRKNASYKTNIGLTNATSNSVTVRVQLLDPNTGLVAGEQSYTLVGYSSVVGEYPFGNLSSGTLKIEIVNGEGAVWAFASVIDVKSEDPEYVPAVPLP